MRNKPQQIPLDLPLKVEYTPGRFTVVVRQKDGGFLFENLVPEEAEFIVRAVNSHETLLEAAKKAKAAIYKESNYHDGDDLANRAINLLEEAIAQAEGGK